jgi:hypothetical protein
VSGEKAIEKVIKRLEKQGFEMGDALATQKFLVQPGQDPLYVFKSPRDAE